MQEEKNIKEPVAADYGSFKNSLIKVGLLLVFVCFCLFFILLNNAASWLLLIFALPVAVVFGWLGKKVFDSKYGWSTEQVGFSPMRIAFGVMLILAVAAMVYLVFHLFK